MTGSNTYLFYMKFIATDGKVKRSFHEKWLNFLSLFFFKKNLARKYLPKATGYERLLSRLSPVADSNHSANPSTTVQKGC